MTGSTVVERRGVRRWLIATLALLVAVAGFAFLAPPAGAQVPDFGEGDFAISYEGFCNEGNYTEITIENLNETYVLWIEALTVEGPDEYSSEIFNDTEIAQSGEATDSAYGLSDGETYSVYGELVWGAYDGEIFYPLGDYELDWSFDSVDCGNGEEPIAETECSAGTACAIPNGGGNWTATCFGCEGAVNVYEPEDIADIEVLSDTTFILKLLTKRGTGHYRSAAVEKVGFGDLPRCFRNRLRTNCVVIIPLFKRVLYLVKVSDDPRFKFR